MVWTHFFVLFVNDLDNIFLIVNACNCIYFLDICRALWADYPKNNY